jgi:hypothetical protein
MPLTLNEATQSDSARSSTEGVMLVGATQANSATVLRLLGAFPGLGFDWFGEVVPVSKELI